MSSIAHLPPRARCRFCSPCSVIQTEPNCPSTYLYPSVAVISCPADDRDHCESSQIGCLLVLITGDTTEVVVRPRRPRKLSGVRNAWRLTGCIWLGVSIVWDFNTLYLTVLLGPLLFMSVQWMVLLRLSMTAFNNTPRLRSGKSALKCGVEWTLKDHGLFHDGEEF